MNSQHHNDIVTSQFDPQAQAYLNSAVHASGEDLDLMARLVGARPNAMALDMGCGGGHAAYLLAPLVKQVVAIDLSETMLAVVRNEAQRRGIANIVAEQGAAEALAWRAESFDVVVSRFSAHHWHDMAAGLGHMRRVLKPGGIAIFMDVVAPRKTLLDTWLQSVELLRDPSHVRDASMAEWHEDLTSAGFKVADATTFRLRLDFPTWIERMKTPASHVAAIRSLQQQAGAEVSNYFEIEEDGSFTIDTMLMAAST